MNFVKIVVDTYIKKLTHRKKSDLLPTRVDQSKHLENITDSLDMSQTSNGTFLVFNC